MTERGTTAPGEIGRSVLDGQEIAILDSMLPRLQPLARSGDMAAVDRVLAILELRLKYRRQRLAEED